MPYSKHSHESRAMRAKAREQSYGSRGTGTEPWARLWSISMSRVRGQYVVGHVDWDVAVVAKDQVFHHNGNAD